MVDCFDRIAVQMTEIALEPVRMLAERPGLSAVSLRTPSNRRRFLITVSKRFPNGEGAIPVFAWSINETDRVGSPIPDGVKVKSEETYTDPEAAYWAGVDALCTETTEPKPRELPPTPPAVPR